MTAKGPLQSDKVVVIPRNTGTSEIAEILKREGVIEQPFLFEAYAYINRQRGQLKAGEFQFKAGTSIEDAIDTLIQGKAILHSVTIPEGLTSEQIIARLYENEILTGDVTETPREGIAAARHLQVRARHDAPADRQHHADRPAAGDRADLAAPLAATCRSRRRRNSSSSPPSSRRRPAGPTSAPASPASSSTAS